VAPAPPRRVAVVVGGDPVDRDLRSVLPAFDVVIAADSGLHAARRLGLVTDVVVGDLDSVDHALLDGLEVEQHPRAKDQTDIELALDRAREHGAAHVVVVSGGGGRLDHALANLLVLASPRYAGMAVDAFVGDARLAVVRDRRQLHGEAGATISLFAVGGAAHGVTTEGLRYVLRDATLAPLSSLGVSNEFEGERAAVTVREGVVLAVRPGPEEPAPTTREPTP
jgi:thiamine pyrophosphokinase